VDTVPPAAWRRWKDQGFLLIGTNRVLAIRSLRDASAAWDALVIRDCYRDLWLDQRVGARYHQELWKPCPAWKVGPANDRMTHCDEFVRFVDAWQLAPTPDENGEAAVMRNSSVVLMAANWAWLRGAREVLLVGVDYCGRHAEMIEPYGSAALPWSGQYDRRVPPATEREFAAAVRAVQAGGGQVWNLSPISRLQTVPRGA
jgi:hypothetical protein